MLIKYLYLTLKEYLLPKIEKKKEFDIDEFTKNCLTSEYIIEEDIIEWDLED